MASARGMGLYRAMVGDRRRTRKMEMEMVTRGGGLCRAMAGERNYCCTRWRGGSGRGRRARRSDGGSFRSAEYKQTLVLVMDNSHAASSADTGQHTPQPSHSLASGVSLELMLCMAYKKMDTQLQESFDPLIQKYPVPTYTRD